AASRAGWAGWPNWACGSARACRWCSPAGPACSRSTAAGSASAASASSRSWSGRSPTTRPTDMPTLDQLRPGEAAVVEAVGGEPAVVQRLLELGLLEGERVELLTRAPLGDPLEIRVGPTRLSLRR